MNARELYQQGHNKGRRGLYKEAVEDFTQAIKINPDFAEAYIARGHARNGVGDKPGQLQDFQKAVDIYRARGELQRADMLLQRTQKLQRVIQMEEQEEQE
jgi:tetratricopeptide (TPR) repeat protein